MALGHEPSSDANGRSAFKLGWGNKFIDVRGPITVWVLGVCAVVGTMFYGVYRVEHMIEQHDAHQHEALAAQWRAVEGFETTRRDELAAFRRRMDIQNCISMFSFEERKAIRTRPQSFTEVCPWIEPEPKPRGPRDS